MGILVSNSGSVNTEVAGQIAYFASSGNTVSGTNAGIGVLVAIANAPNTAGGILVPSGALTLGTPVLGGGPGGSPTSGTKIREHFDLRHHNRDFAQRRLRLDQLQRQPS